MIDWTGVVIPENIVVQQVVIECEVHDALELLAHLRLGFVWKDEHSRKGCRHQTRFFLLAFGNALHRLAVLSVISLASAGLPFQFRDVTMVIAI